jgi:hypothetical protein
MSGDISGADPTDRASPASHTWRSVYALQNGIISQRTPRVHCYAPMQCPLSTVQNVLHSAATDAPRRMTRPPVAAKC